MTAVVRNVANPIATSVARFANKVTPAEGAGLVGMMGANVAQQVGAAKRAGRNPSLMRSDGAMARFKVALNDDLHSEINIRGIFDSIGWGMTVTGGSVTTPRAHALTDVRNNLVCPCWVNIVRDYLGKNYAGGVVTQIAPGAGEYRKTRVVYPVGGAFRYINDAGATYVPNEPVNSGHLLGKAADVLPQMNVEFPFVGTAFTLVYAQLGDAFDYELIVDGVVTGTFSVAGAATFNVERAHVVPAGRHVVRIRNKSATANLRIAALKVDKVIRLANDGLIGTNSDEWLPTGALLPNAVQPTDEFVWVQLGANDRALTTAPKSPTRLTSNLTAIVTWLKAQGKQVVLMASNAVTQDESAMFFDQMQAAQAIAQAASINSVDFVSNFQAVRALTDAGVPGLADGLHPEDNGHLSMGENVIQAIESAPYLDQTTYALLSQIGEKIRRQVVVVNANGVPVGKSQSNVEIPYIEMPGVIVGVSLRAALQASAFPAINTFTVDAGDNPGQGIVEPAALGGAAINGMVATTGTAFVVRLNTGVGTNGRIGFVNRSAAAVDVKVELTIFYVAP